MRRGFTLIELLAVIAILAIIILIAAPRILDAIESSRINAYKQDEQMMVKAAETYFALNKAELPGEIDETIKVQLNTLKTEELISDIKSCDGYILITKTTESFEYKPYINCSNYETEGPGSLDNLVESISHVYNSGTEDYTITIDIRDANKTRNDANSITTPTETIGLYKPSLVDYSNWIVGPDTSFVGWGRNGVPEENEIISKMNPWGEVDIMWASLQNDADSGADGGYNSTRFTIDNTKLYRYTVWVKRENYGTGNGTTYFGIYGSHDDVNTGVALIGNPDYRGTNPYASYWKPTEISYDGNWALLTGYITPVNTMTTPSEVSTSDGIFKLNGDLYKSSSYNYAFGSETNQLQIRSYLFYSTKTDEKHYWYRPRIDAIDGTEPTIAELLSGTENPTMNEYTTLNKTGIIEYTVTTTGTYEFILNRADGSKYTINYTIE